MKIDRGSRCVKRMGAKASLPISSAPPGGQGIPQNTQVAVTVIRRLGFVALKVHDQVMNDLISRGDQETAELFDACFSPLCEALVNFDLRNTEEDAWHEDTDADIQGE